MNKSKYKYIAKFDDDDYYAPNYLTEAINAFKYANAGVIGKGSTFVYFKGKKILAIRAPGLENRYVKFVNGSTLVIDKGVFNSVKFAKLNAAEDVKFCNDCIRKGIKIYSTSKYNHVYIRQSSKNNHTWKIKDDEFIKKYCKVIGKVENYIDYTSV